MGDVLSPTPPPALPPDPTLAAQEAKARTDELKALQVEAQGDTASVMARYGTRLALASGGMSAAVTPSVSSPSNGKGPLG